MTVARRAMMVLNTKVTLIRGETFTYARTHSHTHVNTYTNAHSYAHRKLAGVVPTCESV